MNLVRDNLLFVPNAFETFLVLDWFENFVKQLSPIGCRTIASKLFLHNECQVHVLNLLHTINVTFVLGKLFHISDAKLFLFTN